MTTAGSEQLGTYRRKRDFGRTPEPAGDPAGPPAGGPLRFVVQRHRARRLHYDLRFEMNGVLASWAVPRGPTLDPAARRNAVHVEDHPIEYLDFEGVIPAGEYGGGDVIVWDIGTWEPQKTDDPAAAVAAGELHAELHGSKLRGRLVLVRRDREPGEKEQWLLLHKRDEHAVPGWDPEEHPRSVLSGRTNDEVKADPERLWRSDLPAAEASIALRPPVLPGPTEDELATLDELGRGGTWEVFGRPLRLSNLDKEMFPGRPGEPPVSKRELIRYAARVAPTGRPKRAACATAWSAQRSASSIRPSASPASTSSCSSHVTQEESARSSIGPAAAVISRTQRSGSVSTYSAANVQIPVSTPRSTSMRGSIDSASAAARSASPRSPAKCSSSTRAHNAQ